MDSADAAPIPQIIPITRQYERAACHACDSEPVPIRIHSGTMQKIAATEPIRTRIFT